MLRGRDLYLRLLLSWSAPAVFLLIIIISTYPPDEGTSATALPLRLAAYGTSLVHINWGLRSRPSCWEDVLLVPFLGLRLLFLWRSCLVEQKSTSNIAGIWLRCCAMYLWIPRLTASSQTDTSHSDFSSISFCFDTFMSSFAPPQLDRQRLLGLSGQGCRTF